MQQFGIHWRKLKMRAFFTALSIIIGIIGFVFIILGGYHPRKYQVLLSENASAVQVTQVYTEATYTIAVGVGIVGIAVLVAVIGILFYTNKPLDVHRQSQDNSDPQLTDNPAD
jgi:predicted membrane channel-forming protein YqfA (hemolysin III family)